MVTIYRVENAEGFGPYSVMSRLEPWTYKTLMNHSGDPLRPTGYLDIPRLDWMYTPNYRFGFLLEEDLHRWFEENLLYALRLQGFKVQKYLVDSSKDDEAILLGTTQVAFHNQFAKRIK